MNKHLNIEEITDFAAITNLGAESMRLAKRIYKHTAACAECREALEATLRFYENTGKRMTEGRDLLSDVEYRGGYEVKVALQEVDE